MKTSFGLLLLAASVVSASYGPQSSLSTIPNLSACSGEHSFYSCENTTVIGNACCSPTPGGLVLFTQFWNTWTGREKVGQLLPKASWVSPHQHPTSHILICQHLNADNCERDSPTHVLISNLDFRAHSTVPGRITVMGMQRNEVAIALHLQITCEDHLSNTATFPGSSIQSLLQQFFPTAPQSLLTKDQVLIRLSKISAVMICWIIARGF